MFAHVKVLILSVVLCLTATNGHAVGMQDDGTRTLAIIRDLVLAAFPELRAQNHKVGVSLEGDFDKNWTEFSLGSLSVHAHDANSATHTTRILAGRFWLVGARVREASFEGHAVSSALAKDTAAAVRRKKRWTADEMMNAFARAGARYVPYAADEFIHAVDLKRFEASFGRVVMAKATFIADLPDVPGANAIEFVPLWLVNLETTTAPGIRWCYDLSFEPFNARLIKVDERLCH